MGGFSNVIFLSADFWLLFDALDDWMLVLLLSIVRLIPFVLLVMIFMVLFGLPLAILNFGRGADE